jgi:hypothetical protein
METTVLWQIGLAVAAASMVIAASLWWWVPKWQMRSVTAAPRDRADLEDNFGDYQLMQEPRDQPEGANMAEFKTEQQAGSSLHRISEVDWSQHYQLIGEFMAEFEKITTDLRFVYSILQSRGLKVWQLGELILHIDAIGPRHLSLALCAAVRIMFPDDPQPVGGPREQARLQLRADVDAINTETGELVNMRNKIAHGEWHIGPEVVIVSDTPGLPENMGIKRKLSKGGMTIEKLPTVTDFKSKIARVRTLVGNIKGVHARILSLEAMTV